MQTKMILMAAICLSQISQRQAKELRDKTVLHANRLKMMESVRCVSGTLHFDHSTQEGTLRVSLFKSDGFYLGYPAGELTTNAITIHGGDYLKVGTFKLISKPRRPSGGVTHHVGLVELEAPILKTGRFPEQLTGCIELEIYTVRDHCPCKRQFHISVLDPSVPDKVEKLECQSR